MDGRLGGFQQPRQLRHALCVSMLLVCIMVGFLIMTEKTVVLLPEMPKLNGILDVNDVPKSKQSSMQEYKVLPSVPQEVLAKHTSRLKHLSDTCEDPNVFRKSSSSESGHCLYSNEYNFCYCKVPKVGSTFFLQMFAILKEGPAASESVFAIPRRKVHTSLKGPKRTVREMQTKPRFLLVSRDPYSRLYSAFIDKVYLPNTQSLPNKVASFDSSSKDKRKKSSCRKDASFSSFLKMVVRNFEDGGSFNVHWKPISLICKPCAKNVFVIVKQESFSSDVEFALRQLGVENEKLQPILDGMHSRRVEATIPGIVKTILSKTSHKDNSCLSHVDIAEMIWTSFQIQGFIQDNLAFPRQVFNTEDKAKNNTFLSDVILDTIYMHPMTSKESKDQRYRHLAMAYKSVSPEIISGIKDVYREDFQLFNYSVLPPK